MGSREVLEYATVEGARANGLDSKVGTLTPGKQADLIMLRTDRLNVTPLNDPATAVVTGMDTSNVDTVLIAGKVLKQNGVLLDVDWPALHKSAPRGTRPGAGKVGLQAPQDLKEIDERYRCCCLARPLPAGVGIQRPRSGRRFVL